MFPLSIPPSPSGHAYPLVSLSGAAHSVFVTVCSFED